MSTRTLTELAQLVGGQVVGDGAVVITGTAVLNRAARGQITFVDSPKQLEKLLASGATAAVVPRGFPRTEQIPQLIVEDVHHAFALIVTHFRPQRTESAVGCSSQAFIAPSARLAPDVQVHPFASIGEDVVVGEGTVIHAGVRIMAGCRIGDHVTLYPNVVLYPDTVIGPRSIIHANAVIGANGFGYQFVEGRHQPAAQLGNVEIGADVEIGAGTTIDRGTYDSTTVGDGTKMDNQVMVGHNCQIGRHNLLCSQVGIAGSCTTGDYVVMAGQVGLSDHLHIGDRAVLGAKAGVMSDIPADGVYIGIPALPEKEQWRLLLHCRQLPKIQSQLKKLVQQVNQLGAETELATRPAARRADAA